MAAAIGKTDDAAYYDGLYKRYAAAWRKNFVAADGYTCTSAGTTTLDKNGKPVSYTAGQGWYTSYAMGIMFDLFETEALKKKAAEKLATLLKGDGYAQRIGFIGMNLIYPALGWNGQFDTAMKMMERQEAPSLLYSIVTHGATTIWETYHGEWYSRNHYVFGAPCRWLFTDTLGITHGYDTDNAGYTHFNLTPTYASYSEATVTSAKGSYKAPTGTIKSEWSLSKDRKTFTYKCTVPANTTATLALPVSSANAAITEGGKAANSATGVKYVKTENGRAYYELQSGSYEFVVKN
jgi:alpha-L-rhamnosidase